MGRRWRTFGKSADRAWSDGVTMAPRGAPPARFSYYGRLSAADKKIYRASDEVVTIDVPDAAGLADSVETLRSALSSEKRASVERASHALCRALLERLSVRPLVVKVRSVRPSDHEGELHGLYTWEDGKTPVIEVWMRTARHEHVVAFRTFLRTLLHEVCHHLDFTLLELSQTFHTQGFFRRESSLVRQLAGPASRRRRVDGGEAETKELAASRKPRQLGLFS
jgi:hypothetical protein